MRGGAYAEVLAATDVVRLTKYFATPSGIQFTANQNLLSRLAPQTEASGKFLNEGIYTPLSTLAQAGVGNIGGHLNKQGLDPTGTLGFLSVKNYSDVVYTNNLDDPNTKVSNRLVDLHFMHIENANTDDTDVLSYGGGPGSVLGIGKTRIKFATKADGVTPLRLMGSNGKDPKKYLVPGNKLAESESSTTNDFLAQVQTIAEAQSGSVFHLTSTYNLPFYQMNTPKFEILGSEWTLKEHKSIANPYSPITSGSYLSPSQLKKYLTPGASSQGLAIYNASYINDIAAQTTSSYSSQINPYLIKSFREIVDDVKFNSKTQTMSAYVSGSNIPLGEYDSTNSIIVDAKASAAKPEDKYNLHKNGYLANLNKSVGYYIDPNGGIKRSPTLLGNHGIGPDFRKASRNIRGFGDDNINYYDHVTAYSDYYSASAPTVDSIYYKSGNKRESTTFGSANDLVTFNITLVNTSDPTKATPHIFRAYIDNLSDSYDADWSAQTYMGRGEKLYKYNSFGRTISLGFTVVAEGKHHLDVMYNSLNEVAASLSPYYNGYGYMSGNIQQVTIGNYINKQYGIITGLTFDIDNESPWEIKAGEQLPHFIKVTGFKFTPIHNFRPEYNPNNKSHKYIYQT